MCGSVYESQEYREAAGRVLKRNAEVSADSVQALVSFLRNQGIGSLVILEALNTFLEWAKSPAEYKAHHTPWLYRQVLTNDWEYSHRPDHEVTPDRFSVQIDLYKLAVY